MRILYDGEIFRFQTAGGINRYFAELISALPDDWIPTVIGVRDFGTSIPHHPSLTRPPYFRPKWCSAPQRIWGKHQLLKKTDVFHPTYYELTKGFSLSDIRCPMLLTVYDFVYARYSKVMARSESVIRSQATAIGRADHIICISKSTENDLLERFPSMQDRTTVIHLGSSFEVQPQLIDYDVYENPYFLFVGSRDRYKNFLFVLQAFAKASQVNARIRLRVAGAPLNSEESSQLSALGLGDLVDSVIYPNEQDLLTLYQHSLALLYPSLYEGFGLPPLEAMACRILAITSNTSSLPEVVGDAGIMLDPGREADWVDCMLEVAKAGIDRKRMTDRGAEQARKFSWSACVQQHLEVYKRLGKL